MNEATPQSPVRCHNCGSAPLQLSAAYAQLRRVSSDCQARPAGGQLGLCPSCGLVQAVTDLRWQQEAKEIYQAYSIYHQSGGIEQPVFDPKTGQRRSRSESILTGLIETASLPERGRLLDIGCGNGGFLRACSRGLANWTLYGSEFDERHREVVEAIPGVEKLYAGDLDKIPGLFDVISLVHVLEHIPGPSDFLKRVAAKLKPDGWLLIEVPDCTVNPFMLLVADHSSHFSPSALARVVAAAGFELARVGPGWVPKEISLVARRPRVDAKAEPTFAQTLVLHATADEAGRLALEGNFGIFGTSIGATWLDAQTNRGARFFVDEDRDRVGRNYDGRPILNVAQIPNGSVVYVVLAPAVAKTVAERLRSARPDVTFMLPPAPHALSPT